MIDLKDITLIIPVRFESEDRIRNAFTSLTYLLNNFDLNIILKESDKSPRFELDVLPKIKAYTNKDKLKNLTYIFEQTEDEIFDRMRIINEMLYISKTSVIGNYDVDIILEKETMQEVLRLIKQEDYDVIYPYGLGDYQFAVNSNYDLINNFIENNYNFEILHSNGYIKSSHSGHIQFFKKDSYISGGMENENFKSSSPEDQERFHRFQKLGYKVGRINHLVYHMEHVYDHSKLNTVPGNPHFNENWNLFNRLIEMSSEDLKSYYDNQEYLKKYKKKV